MKKRTKYITLLALAIVVSAFFLPIYASAGDGGMGKPGEVTPSPAPQPTSQPTSLPSPLPGAPWEDAPQEDAPSDTPPTPPPTPQPTPTPGSPWDNPPDDGNPFTPDGQATVEDNATSDDGKEFFTFTTPEGNVFFLVIDRNRPQDNVYFLNFVTEQDLMALAERSDDTPWAPLPEPLPPTPEPEPEQLPEEPLPPIETGPQGGNHGTTIFVIIAAIAFGGAAYYFKIIRPKKQGADFDEEEDEEEDDFDENYEEDEQEEYEDGEYDRNQ